MINSDFHDATKGLSEASRGHVSRSIISLKNLIQIIIVILSYNLWFCIV